MGDSTTGSGARSHLVEQYYKVHVETAPKDQLLLMVLDGMLRFVDRAREAMETGALEEKNTCLQKTQALLLELDGALSPEIGEKLYRDLRGLYFFVYRKLIEANLRNSIELLDEGRQMLVHISETWRLAVKQYRAEVHSAQGTQEAAPQGAPEGERERLSITG